ncbi:hypothetical protein GGS26DRAFT_584335 [Hypomontagnella submonticulosa]|nr:hypothetical protein GGS26DRAFT_584335 [Hypomontagnella submonticulosa]
MQDPHRQPPLPPSSAHPSFSSYPPREPVVKRDPGEETSLPQLRRPNSTGNVADNLPPGPHGPPHPNPPPDDPRRHMSYDSGPSMPHSPAMYRPPQPYHPPPPPTPVAQHPQYDSPHVYGHPPSMYPLEIATSAKRKAQRASQACDSCRQLKAKCDETKPCKNCKEKNIECKYREPPAKQPDKVTADLLDMLTSMREEINSKLSNINRELAGLNQANMNQNQRVNNIETKIKQLNSGTDMKVESIEEEERPDFHDSPLPSSKAQVDETLSSPGGTVVEPSLTIDEAHAALQEANDDDMEDNPGPAVAPGKPAMPPNHTTLAGLLLKWPSIKRMVHHLLEAEKITHPDEYPIRQELQRGVLRIFGRGEGSDQDIRSSDKETPPDHTMTDIDDASDVAASPSPMGGEAWGQVGSLTPPPGVEYRGGVVNVDGNPDWDSTRIWRYVNSFKDNILNMHPIIIPRELTAMVKIFLESLPKSQDRQSIKTGAARFVNQPIAAPPSFPETGTKRKRSPAADEQIPSTTFVKPGRPFRSVQNALVLLVFALGKICLHKDKIPDPVHESDSPMHHSPSVRNGVLASPLQGSPPGFMSQSQSNMPSPKESERIPMSRRASLQGNPPMSKGSHSHRRNLDVIPGLEYFALAMDIMGSHGGGLNLKHVYVQILTGLYYGQLGRVLESWSYISLASRNLQVILRPSLDRLSKWHDQGRSIGQSRRDNQLAFAFWTCLQLESDILAELPLPQSGILQYEDRMPYPNSEYAVNQGFSEHIVTGYIAQLYLRKQLNQVHTLLYDSEKQSKNKNGITLSDPVIEEGITRIEEMLKNSRHRWVPSSYLWDDEDPPASDILGARLRAKYWGSQVILYRPFLRAILERELFPNHYQADSPENQDNDDLRRHVDGRIMGYAAAAIHALVESTRAFHGIPRSQRIIITNVFGTAHAQWGNLLTLAACYRDRWLRQYIETETLSNLFSRTISFFQSIAHPTSALKNDMNILIGLAKDLGFIRDEYDAVSTSFSSASSSGPLPPIHNPSDNYHGPPSATFGRPHLPPPNSIS